jgi:DNA-directed RNA polymerase subunit RPC12/RpoP
MDRKANLNLVPLTSDDRYIEAPPILVLSRNSDDYRCGSCGTPLIRAEAVEALKLLIRCTNCGAYNSTMVSQH